MWQLQLFSLTINTYCMHLPVGRLVFVFKCHVLRARFLRDMIGLKSFMLFNSLLMIGRERCQFVASTCQALEPTEPSSQTEKRLNGGTRGVFYGCTAFASLSYLGTVCILEALKMKPPLSVHRGMQRRQTHTNVDMANF